MRSCLTTLTIFALLIILNGWIVQYDDPGPVYGAIVIWLVVSVLVFGLLGLVVPGWSLLTRVVLSTFAPIGVLVLISNIVGGRESQG